MVNTLSPPDERSRAAVSEVARGARAVFASKTIGRLIRFGLQILFARFLGVAGWGIYVLIVSFAELARAFGTLGLDRGALRFGAIAQGDRASLRRLFFLTLGGATLCGLAISALLLVFLEPIADLLGLRGHEAPFRAAVGAISLLAATMVASALMRSAERVGVDGALQELAQPITQIVLFGLLIVAGTPPLTAAVWSLLISTIGIGFVTLVLVWRVTFRSEPVAGPAVELATPFEAATMLRYSAMMFLVTLGGYALLRFDKILLASRVSAVEVGLYSAAAMIAAQNNILLQAINASFSPRIARMFHARQLTELGYVLKVMNRWTILLSLPVVIGTVLFRREILLLIGAPFQAASAMLAVLTIGQFVTSGTGSVGVLLNMSGNQRVELINALTGLVVLTVGMILLAPRWGGLGGACAMAAAIAVVNIARVVQVRVVMGIHPFERGTINLLLCGLGAWLMSLIYMPILPGNVLLRIGLGLPLLLLSYSALVWVGALTDGERTSVRSALHRFAPNRA